MKAFPDCALYHMEQRTPEWFAVRRGLLTASEFGPWLFDHKTKKAVGARHTMICKLLAQIADQPEAPVFETWAMKRGTDLEPEAQAAFERATGLRVANVGFARSVHGSFGCSPDGLIFSNDVGYENKCPLPARHIEYYLAGVVPPEHWWQIVGCMAVTGASGWWFQSYCPGLPSLRVFVERNAEAEKLLVALTEFSEELETAREHLEEMWETEI
jgi:hypothetical protein